MNQQKQNPFVLQAGFTLVEIAVVLLIVTILLGYTVALFPIQQELKQYRSAESQMREIVDALIGHAQVNGRLPCADANGDGFEDWAGGLNDCTAYVGSIPGKTIGFDGDYVSNELVDPWGTPYTYQVASFDIAGSQSHFTLPGDMRNQGIANLVPAVPDQQYLQVCSAHPTGQTAATIQTNTDCIPVSTRVASNLAVVIVSHGKDRLVAAAGTSDIQSENLDNVVDTAGPNPAINDTVFVSSPRSDAVGGEFDDVVKWISLNQLFSAMIKAEQLP